MEDTLGVSQSNSSRKQGDTQSGMMGRYEVSNEKQQYVSKPEIKSNKVLFKFFPLQIRQKYLALFLLTSTKVFGKCFLHYMELKKKKKRKT